MGVGRKSTEGNVPLVAPYQGPSCQRGLSREVLPYLLAEAVTVRSPHAKMLSYSRPALHSRRTLLHAATLKGQGPPFTTLTGGGATGITGSSAPDSERPLLSHSFIYSAICLYWDEVTAMEAAL